VRRRDLAAAAVLLVFGVVAVSQARALRLGSIAAPGPGFFPLGLAVALSLVSAGLLVAAARAPAAPAPPVAGTGAGRRLEVVGTLAALLAYALTLETLGFRLATFGLLLFFFKALQRQRGLVALGTAVGTALLIDVVFRRWLGVNLPAGAWGL
jgi:putative tricarboxylic transport membrane protein